MTILSFIIIGSAIAWFVGHSLAFMFMDSSEWAVFWHYLGNFAAFVGLLAVAVMVIMALGVNVSVGG